MVVARPRPALEVADFDMSGLIRHRDAEANSTVRPFRPLSGRAAVCPAQAIDPQLILMQSEIETLQHQLETRDRQIEELAGAVEEAKAKGLEDGKAQGHAEAERGRDDFLAIIEEAATSALTDFHEALGSLERLAPLLASECLSRLVDEPANFEAVTAGILRLQLDKLENGSVVRVELSAKDFPSAAELEQFLTRLGRPNLSVEASGALNAGDCRIKLSLGAIEVGIGQQWSELRSLLAEMSKSEAAA
jgi:flagellar biosynthesis/type III secretory pathway protein FliH